MKANHYLRILTQLALFAVAASRTNNFAGRTACYRAFALAGFDIYDFDSYPDFFNDESIFQLAQTGTYSGAAGIEEYVRFASPTSPYIESLKTYDKNAQVKTASDPDTGECVMTVVVTSAARYSAIAKPNTATTRSALLKLYFEPTSFNTIAISKIYGYYEEGYLEEFTGVVTNTDQTRDFICTAMRDNCASIWELNGLSTIDECSDKLLDLPAAEEKADMSGNTQACRMLHAAFASTNPKHCPHISFLPVEDESGKLKCQESAFRPVEEMFDENDMEVFDTRREYLGLENDMAAVFCDCAEEQEEPSWWAKIATFFNELRGAGPLPETWSYGTIPYCEICYEDF